MKFIIAGVAGALGLVVVLMVLGTIFSYLIGPLVIAAVLAAGFFVVKAIVKGRQRVRANKQFTQNGGQE